MGMFNVKPVRAPRIMSRVVQPRKGKGSYRRIKASYR